MTNRRIWKYVFEGGTLEILMPQDSQFLHTGLDPISGNPAMWFSVIPSRDSEPRSFEIHGTGADIPWSQRFLGTVQKNAYMLHIFEDTSKKHAN